MRVRDEDLPTNNDYTSATSSASRVVMPAKAPTVPPPPTHRLPPLEIQRARAEARQPPLVRPDPGEDSGSESTDSGEYTIRDGSHPSSGGYQANTYTQEESRESTPPPSRSERSRSQSQAAATALSASVLASMFGEANGHRNSAVTYHETTHAFSDTSVWIVFVLGLGIGVTVERHSCGAATCNSCNAGLEPDQPSKPKSKTKAGPACVSDEIWRMHPLPSGMPVSP